MLFIQYPACSTCKKAKKYLQDHQITFEDRHIKEESPTLEELSRWYPKTGLAIQKLFNTSGQVYRSGNIKDKLPTMTEEEKLALLASDGMLVKRPILILEKRVLIGFKEAEWEAALREEGYLK